MTWSWFDLAFPWIGVAAAVALLALLFGTPLLRSPHTSSRWRDVVWLSWLGAVAYLLHNGEEYGVDLFGRLHAFPDALCANLRQPPYPECAIPPAFYLAVNLPLFWVAAPLGALLSRRHPFVGLAIYGVIFANGLVHVVPLFLGVGYSPGTLTAAVLFLPLSVWVAHTCSGNGRLSYKALALLIANGVILHVVLAGSMLLFLGGRISVTALLLVQVVNAALFLLLPWGEERFPGLGPSLGGTASPASAPRG